MKNNKFSDFITWLLFLSMVWFLKYNYDFYADLKESGKSELVEIKNSRKEPWRYRSSQKWIYDVRGTHSYKIKSDKRYENGEQLWIIVEPGTYTNLQIQHLGKTSDPTYTLVFQNLGFGLVFGSILMLGLGVLLTIKGAKWISTISNWKQVGNDLTEPIPDEIRIWEGMSISEAESILEENFKFLGGTTQPSYEILQYQRKWKKNRIVTLEVSEQKIVKIKLSENLILS